GRVAANQLLINQLPIHQSTLKRKSPTSMCSSGLNFLERETGLEPATSTLARRRKLMKIKENHEVLDGTVFEVRISDGGRVHQLPINAQSMNWTPGIGQDIGDSVRRRGQ